MNVHQLGPSTIHHRLPLRPNRAQDIRTCRQRSFGTQDHFDGRHRYVEVYTAPPPPPHPLAAVLHSSRRGRFLGPLTPLMHVEQRPLSLSAAWTYRAPYSLVIDKVRCLRLKVPQAPAVTPKMTFVSRCQVNGSKLKLYCPKLNN